MLDEKDFIPFTNDLVFKTMLSKKENLPFLESMLESQLKYEKGSLCGKCTVVAEAFLPKFKADDKSLRADVIVKFDNTIVDIEMYRYYNKKSKRKSFFYILRLAGNIDKGNNYEIFKNIIGLNYVQNVSTLVPAYDEFEFRSNITGNKYLENGQFKIIVFNLDKLEELEYNVDSKTLKVLKYFNAKSFAERNAIVKGDKQMEEFNENVNDFIIDAQTREMFDYVTAVEKEAALYRHGELDGIEAGIKKNKIEVCKKMKAKGIDLETIVDVTGLSIEEIEKL